MLRRRLLPLLAPALFAVACAGGGGAATSQPVPVGAGDPQRGRALWGSQAQPTCSTCHMINGQGATVGPDLSHIATVAASRRPGFTAEPYIRTHITDPAQFTVPGFPAGVMPSYRGSLTDQQLNDIVAYYMTLK